MYIYPKEVDEMTEVIIKLLLDKYLNIQIMKMTWYVLM
jgi:hypothetical protein